MVCPYHKFVLKTLLRLQSSDKVCDISPYKLIIPQVPREIFSEVLISTQRKRPPLADVGIYCCIFLISKFSRLDFFDDSFFRVEEICNIFDVLRYRKQ